MAQRQASAGRTRPDSQYARNQTYEFQPPSPSMTQTAARTIGAAPNTTMKGGGARRYSGAQQGRQFPNASQRTGAEVGRYRTYDEAIEIYVPRGIRDGPSGGSTHEYYSAQTNQKNLVHPDNPFANPDVAPAPYRRNHKPVGRSSESALVGDRFGNATTREFPMNTDVINQALRDVGGMPMDDGRQRIRKDWVAPEKVTAYDAYARKLGGRRQSNIQRNGYGYDPGWEGSLQDILYNRPTHVIEVNHQSQNNAFAFGEDSLYARQLDITNRASAARPPPKQRELVKNTKRNTCDPLNPMVTGYDGDELLDLQEERNYAKEAAKFAEKERLMFEWGNRLPDAIDNKIQSMGDGNLY